MTLSILLHNLSIFFGAEKKKLKAFSEWPKRNKEMIERISFLFMLFREGGLGMEY